MLPRQAPALRQGMVVLAQRRNGFHEAHLPAPLLEPNALDGGTAGPCLSSPGEIRRAQQHRGAG